MNQLAGYIDHTQLSPTTTLEDVKKCCTEARQYGFAAVCIPPVWVSAAAEFLSGSGIHTATVIGFPFGYSVTAAKLAEAEQALREGADELDVVINRIHLASDDWETVEEEIRLLTDYIHKDNKVIKVIVESGMLTEKQLIKTCSVLGPLGIDFMKTSTGFAEKGASTAAIRLMRQHLPPHVAIKASGGIRDARTARHMIKAGAKRLGCSASVAIVGQITDHPAQDY